MNGFYFLDNKDELDLETFRVLYKKLADSSIDLKGYDINNFVTIQEKIQLAKIVQDKLPPNSLTLYPLVHYLFEVFNTKEAYLNQSIRWLIFNIEVIELLDPKEHETTIQQLCTHFRLASQKATHHRLYTLLPDLPIELETLINELLKIEQENKDLIQRSLPSDLTESEITKISRIRVAYQYAFTQKDRLERNRTSSGRSNPIKGTAQKIITVTLDGEETNQTQLQLGDDQTSIEDKEIETFEDHNFKFTPIEKISISVQKINLKNKVLHQNKNDLKTKSNPRVYDLQTAKIIFQELYEKAANSPIHTLLLISVLSFTHYENLLIFNKKARPILKNKTICLSPIHCYFTQSFDVSKFKDIEFKEYMLNTVNSFTIPLPKIYFEQFYSLKKWDHADIESDVKEYLRKINEKITFNLNSQNLIRLLSDITLNELGYELESKLLIGENTNHYIPCHYFSTTTVDILDIYQQTLGLVCQKFNTDYIYESAFSIFFGSQQTPELDFAKKYFYALDQQVRKNPNIFQTLNYYSIWLWHICMILTSARPTESFPPNLDYIDLDNKIFAVVDKEQRYTQTVGRYIPFNNYLKTEIVAYLKFLKHFQNLMRACLMPEKYLAIQQVLDGERAFLLFYDSTHYVRNLKLSDIQKLFANIPLARNWTRHFDRYFFAQDFVHEDLLKGIFGHDEAMQELFDRYSGFSVLQYEQIRQSQDKLVQALELKSMANFNGITIE